MNSNSKCLRSILQKELNKRNLSLESEGMQNTEMDEFIFFSTFYFLLFERRNNNCKEIFKELVTYYLNRKLPMWVINSYTDLVDKLNIQDLAEVFVQIYLNAGG